MLKTLLRKIHFLFYHSPFKISALSVFPWELFYISWLKTCESHLFVYIQFYYGNSKINFACDLDIFIRHTLMKTPNKNPKIWSAKLCKKQTTLPSAKIPNNTTTFLFSNACLPFRNHVSQTSEDPQGVNGGNKSREKSLISLAGSDHNDPIIVAEDLCRWVWEITFNQVGCFRWKLVRHCYLEGMTFLLFN